jgi:hypothetical protein
MKIVIEEKNGAVNCNVQAEREPDLTEVMVIMQKASLSLAEQIRANRPPEEKPLIEIPTGPMFNGLKVV